MHLIRETLASRKFGGIIFMRAKFSLEDGETAHPSVCDRTNVVVISDEPHRSQYGMNAKLNKKTGTHGLHHLGTPSRGAGTMYRQATPPNSGSMNHLVADGRSRPPIKSA